MMTPFFSVIIPLYNKEKHIEATLESVWFQTFKNFEVIIVNDGSTDNSLNVVNTIKDKRLRVYTTKNQGVSKARNYGIEQATASFIVFLDADDIWLKHHLQDLKDLHTAFPNCGMYCKAYHKRHGKTKIPSRFKNIPNTTAWKGILEDYFLSSTINSIAWTSAVMVPKSVINAIGNFDPKITLGAGEDTDLWIRIALKYNVAFNNNVSAIHQLHSSNRISNSNTDLRQFIDLDKYNDEAKSNTSLKKYLDLNRFYIAMQYKLIGNKTKAKTYIDGIDKRSLNYRQQFLLKQSHLVLKMLFKIKNHLKQLGILLSSH